MKDILVVKDPEYEVGFKVLTDYCYELQKILGNEVQVLPIWPSGEIELITDNDEKKLYIANLKDVIAKYELGLNEAEKK